MLGGTQYLNQADGVFSENGTGGSWSAGHDNYPGNPRVKFSHSHSHTVSVGSTGSNLSHNNLQPYIVVYRFRRTN